MFTPEEIKMIEGRKKARIRQRKKRFEDKMNRRLATRNPAAGNALIALAGHPAAISADALKNPDGLREILAERVNLVEKYLPVDSDTRHRAAGKGIDQAIKLLEIDSRKPSEDSGIVIEIVGDLPEEPDEPSQNE